MAEKVDAIILLGIRNSRMKDYSDLWTLVNRFRFDASLLTKAIQSTLERRGRGITSFQLTGLQDEFAENPSKQTQWRVFLRRTVPDQTDLDLQEVVLMIREFLSPVLKSIVLDQSPRLFWTPENRWMAKAD